MQRIAGGLCAAGPCLAGSALVHPGPELPMQSNSIPCSSPASRPRYRSPSRLCGEGRKQDEQAAAWAPRRQHFNRRDLIRTQMHSMLLAIPVPFAALHAIRLPAQSHTRSSRVSCLCTLATLVQIQGTKIDRGRSGVFVDAPSTRRVYTFDVAVVSSMSFAKQTVVILLDLSFIVAQ